MQLVDDIKEAFGKTPYPGSNCNQISVSYDDEGIYEYFVGSDQFDHHVSDLRYHSCALSFFTNEAFRYWLPAFMIAELTEPDEADIIGESIAYQLSSAIGGSSRLGVFDHTELLAIRAFLNWCKGDHENSPFDEAMKFVTRAINLAEAQ